MNLNLWKPHVSLLLAPMLLAGLPRLHAQSLTLVAGGKSDYVIVVPRDASPNCTTAIAELRSYLQRISGADIPAADAAPAGHAIFFEEGKSSDASFDVNQLNNDGFRIKTAKDNLYFTAKSGQGLKNAVYTFLDDDLGCRYYASNAIFIPKKPDLKLPALNDVENPALISRTTPFISTRDRGFAAWQKLSGGGGGGGGQRQGWGLFVHTMNNFVPASAFAAHPEYFAERNGVRVADQLCLANPEVLRMTIESLRQRMAQNPTAKYWSVSQLDNYQYCECDKCKAIDDREGSPSGSIINFVNQVAAQFPDKVISTLAYQYSRKPPLHIKPATNVNIMLCSIESDRSKPISEDKGDGFARDLVGWAKISDDIMIWDYVVNFSHLVAPFPNFHVLKPNINLFVDNHATQLFEQGHGAAGAEFNELRCYLICKLMWNPKADEDKLMNDFLTGYYGKAGPLIRQYIDLETKNVMKGGRALSLYEPPASYVKGYLSPANIKQYFTLVDKAMDTVKDDATLSNRVEVVRQSLRYAWLEVCKYQMGTPDWVFEKDPDATDRFRAKPQAKAMLETFYQTSQQFGNQRLNEKQLFMDTETGGGGGQRGGGARGGAVQGYYPIMKDYFASAVANHLAVGKKITLEKPYSPKYAANGPNSLIDGVRGTIDYQVLWQGWNGDDCVATIDLLSPQTVSRIETSSVDDWLSWIIAPAGITVEVSQDGKTFIPAASYTNPTAGKKIDKQVVKFSVPLDAPVSARYVKVRIKNVGKLPSWRGVNGNAWLFVDEIVVK